MYHRFRLVVYEDKCWNCSYDDDGGFEYDGKRVPSNETQHKFFWDQDGCTVRARGEREQKRKVKMNWFEKLF